MQRLTLAALLAGWFFTVTPGCGGSSKDQSSGQGNDAISSNDTTSSGDWKPGDDATFTCAEGYTCFRDPEGKVVWVIKNDGNVNGPDCKSVCEAALSQSCEFHACDSERVIETKDIASFARIAAGLGFTCKKGGCWDSKAPSAGLILVSINSGADGSKTCYFPEETTFSCSNHPGNANCFGERYASVCPCVPKPLDQACSWSCPPNHTTRAVWKTQGTSCVERINYWRKRACEEGWPECPPAGLPPMVECTACHECANSQAAYDKLNGAHASFKRCGELVQGVGGGQTCADVIDSFVSERAPDENGIMRCTGHCGPILAHGCQTFFWGRDRDSGLHVLNWRSCNATLCQQYCADNPGDCFSVETSTPKTCDDPSVDAEPGPKLTCP
ncbi:MAG: hypothetical protein KC609_17070 [Myxococcales bacterium]|nr:hypothetical protein [Myxococcales bacterium]